jgi:hypothetical protein
MCGNVCLLGHQLSQEFPSSLKHTAHVDGALDRDKLLRRPGASGRELPDSVYSPDSNSACTSEHQYQAVNNEQTPWPLVRKRIVPTERPSIVDEI